MTADAIPSSPLKTSVPLYRSLFVQVLVALLERPMEGEVRFEGKPVTPREARALRRRVTLVEQRPVLFRGTVRANLEYGLRVRGTRGTEAPLKGTKLDKAEALAADPPVPPPVKLAPFGYGIGVNNISRCQKIGGERERESRTPIGRELSVNWHVDDVHMQFPAIGSQNGVEQLEGTT